MKRLRHMNQRLNEKGQAVLEYILMLALILSLFTALALTFNRWVKYLWQVMTCEISAACPACPPDPDIRNRISTGCRH